VSVLSVSKKTASRSLPNGWQDTTSREYSSASQDRNWSGEQRGEAENIQKSAEKRRAVGTPATDTVKGARPSSGRSL